MPRIHNVDNNIPLASINLENEQNARQGADNNPNQASNLNNNNPSVASNPLNPIQPMNQASQYIGTVVHNSHIDNLNNYHGAQNKIPPQPLPNEQTLLERIALYPNSLQGILGQMAAMNASQTSSFCDVYSPRHAISELFTAASHKMKQILYETYSAPTKSLIPPAIKATPELDDTCNSTNKARIIVSNKQKKLKMKPIDPIAKLEESKRKFYRAMLEHLLVRLRLIHIICSDSVKSSEASSKKIRNRYICHHCNQNMWYTGPSSIYRHFNKKHKDRFKKDASCHTIIWQMIHKHILKHYFNKAK
eukprot:272295_1